MIELDDLELSFAGLRRSRGLRRSLEITGEGIVLGPGTLLARRVLGGEEPRILALLAAAHGHAVSAQILGVIRKALDLWSHGEKFLSQLHLSHARLPPLTGDQAFALFAQAGPTGMSRAAPVQRTHRVTSTSGMLLTPTHQGHATLIHIRGRLGIPWSLVPGRLN